MRFVTTSNGLVGTTSFKATTALCVLPCPSSSAKMARLCWARNSVPSTCADEVHFEAESQFFSSLAVFPVGRACNSVEIAPVTSNLAVNLTLQWLTR